MKSSNKWCLRLPARAEASYRQAVSILCDGSGLFLFLEVCLNPWVVGIAETHIGYDTTTSRRKSIVIIPISSTNHVAGSGTEVEAAASGATAP